MQITWADVALLAELFSPLCASTYCRQKKKNSVYCVLDPLLLPNFKEIQSKRCMVEISRYLVVQSLRWDKIRKKKKNCCGHATAFLLSTSPAVTSPFFADYELLTQHQIEGTSPHYSSWWHASTCARSLFGDNRLKHSVIRCVKLHG